MTPTHDPVSEKALLNLTARSIGLAADRVDATDLLDNLEVSIHDLMALVAILEDRCDVVLPDCELARCETLGDLIDHLRAGAVLRAVLTPGGHLGQTADASRHDRGPRAPEGDPRRRAPGRRPTGLGAGQAQQRRAS